MSVELIRLATGPDGRLRLMERSGFVAVRAIRCFPWSAPSRHVSLRDAEGRERAFLDNPEKLDATSAEALARELALTGFVFLVRKLIAVEQDIELRVWHVQTHRGSRRFQTELDHWPEPVPGGGWLLRDVAGDLYRFPPLAEMDRASRRRFAPFQE